MFISRLKNSILRYDPYGEHRINGLKAVLITELLFVFNYFYSIPNPYFHYFYIPLTAFAAEIVGETLKEKFILYFFTVAGSILAVMGFDLSASYQIFFIAFAFGYSLLLYWVGINKLKNMFVPAPLILSLASYSLIYGNTNSGFYAALNHALISIVALTIAMSGLILFPRRYYFWIWRNAFTQALIKVSNYVGQIQNGTHTVVPIIPDTIVMEKYAKMLMPKMKIYSVLKITILTMDLVMSLSYLVAFQNQLRAPYIEFLHRQLKALIKSCLQKQPLNISSQDQKIFHETHELRSLMSLISSWNYLCLDH